MTHALRTVGRIVGVCYVSALCACGNEDESPGKGAIDAGDLDASSGGASNGSGGDGGGVAGSGGATPSSGGSGGTQTGGAGGVRQTGGSGGAITADDIAKAGIVLGSCWPDDGPNRNIAHIYNRSLGTELWYQFGTQTECIASSGGGCDALETCLGLRWAPSDAGVCPQSCDGTLFSVCGLAYQMTFDCASIGMQCDEDALCNWGEPAIVCDETTFMPTCTSEGRPEVCIDGVVQHGVDCDDLGLACADGACRGTGVECVSNDSESRLAYTGLGCNGTMLDACVGGRRATRDCAAVAPGMSCQTFGGAYFCGYASECLPGEVDPGTSGTVESCDGTTLVYCHAGRIERIDCVDLGFTGCGDGVANTPSCTPSALSQVLP